MNPKTRLRLEVVLIALSMMLIAVSLVLPEFKTTTTIGSATPESVRTTVTTYYLGTCKVSTRLGHMSWDTSYSGYDMSISSGIGSIGHLMSLEMLLLATWIFLCWMLLTFILFSKRLFQVVIGWMAVIAGVISAAYPVMSIPGSILNISSFYGNSTSQGTTSSWGPSIAWYLSVISVVLIGALVVRRMSSYFMEPKKETDYSGV